MIEAVEMAKVSQDEITDGFSGTSNDVRVFDQNLESGLGFMFLSALPKVFKTNINGSTNVAQYCLVHVWEKQQDGTWKQLLEQDAEGNMVPSVRRWFPGPMMRALTPVLVDENDTEKAMGTGARVKASGAAAMDIQKHAHINEAIAAIYNKCVVDDQVQQIITVDFPESKRIWTRNPNYTVGGTQPKHRQQNIGVYEYATL